MKKKERAALIREILKKYFPDPAIPLAHTSPYTLLIAVLLSARSTDAQVNKITPLLFSRAKTPQKMIEMSVEEIRKIIKPCGLSPAKAKNIHALSKILLEKHGGKVPSTFSELEALPGIGHKSASVLMAQAFGKPAFPVDTHIFRSARRWGLSKGKTVLAVEKDLKALFPEKEWIDIHLQMIYFARTFCPSRGHKKDLCPICSCISSCK